MKPIQYNDFTKEYLETKEELDSIFQRVLLSGQYILGKEVESFEKQFAKYLGVKFCIGVGNGLNALQISLMALGIKEGDEIITTPISAAATTLAILAIGAKPIFIDVTDKGLMNPDLIPQRITKKTRAILPVHLYGQPADLNKLKKISRKYHLSLVDDACQAHGSLYQGKKIGSFTDLTCFSFYPTKNLGTVGDGGAITTNNKKLALACKEIRNYGQRSKYNHIRYGINSRLDELHAAVLSLKLKLLDKRNRKRKILTKRYIQKLSSVPSIEIVTDLQNESNFHLFVIRTKQRNNLQKFLSKNSIPTDIHYPKIIPKQKFMKAELNLTSFKEAENFVKEILSLPCHPHMKIGQVDYICSKIEQGVRS